MARPVVFILVVDSPTRHLFGHARSGCVMRTPLLVGRRVAYSVTRSLQCRTTVESRHSRMGFPFLPQLCSAAELFVVDLVAQHNPQPDPQFAGGRDPRLAHSFLDELASIESFQLWVFSGCMHRRLRP